MKCYFFGSFNPIHLGHIEIARRIQKQFDFDNVVFVPSYIPPHKHDLENYTHRLDMVKLAVGEENVSDIEAKLPVPSYTYRTIEKLKEVDNTEKINFIIGYDQFFKIESWKEPELLKRDLNFIVIPRKFQNGQTINIKAFDYFKNKGFYFKIADIDFLDVSSNMIRNYLSKNEDITGLTTPEVKNYIEKHGLYRKMADFKTIG